MCYFRHYNKSSNWYPFVGLETFLFINCLIDNYSLLHARPNCDQTLLHLKTIVHWLWYIRCCTQLQILLSHSSSSSSSSKFIVRLLQNGHRCITECTVMHCLKSMVSSFPAENKAVNIATFAVVRVVLYGVAPYRYLDQSYTFHSYV